MKYASKMACLVLLVIMSNLSFGMTRVLMRKPAPPRHYQELSPQRRLIQTKAAPETVKTSATLSDRIQQKLAELKIAGWRAWNNLINKFSRAPAITVTQSTLLPTRQEDSFKDDFDTLLNIIENKLEKIKPITKKPEELASRELKKEIVKIAEKSFILCPTPTNEIRHLLRVKSLSTFEEYIKNKKRFVFKKMGFTNTEIETMENEINFSIALFMQQYKQAKKYSDHDQTIPQLDITKQALQKVGIDPSSISIRSIPKTPGALLGSVHLEFVSGTSMESLLLQTNKPDPHILPYLMQQVLSLQPISDVSKHDEKIFIIAHEIAHLVKGHAIERYVIMQHWLRNIAPKTEMLYTTQHQKSKYINRILLLIQKELASLYELEADIWVATRYQKLAEIIQKATIQDIKERAILSDIYLTTAERLYVLTKIIQLHKEADSKNKPITDTTKE